MSTFIPKSARALAVVVIVALVLALISIFATDGAEGVLLSLPTIALVAQVTLMLFWFPKVQVDKSTVVIKNVARSFAVPMHRIARIDTRWALTLYLDSGKKITSWSATAPGRHTSIFASREQGQHLPESTYLAGTVRPGDLLGTDSGSAAATIRRYWETRKEGSDELVINWNLTQILTFGLLVALNFLLLR